jgi:4-amino-4-deoxy-L-arabinose transferase-like glycosyltransferase
MTNSQSRNVPSWCWIVLLAILLFDVWLRGHTLGPTVKQAIGFAPWPVVRGSTEPLDCDEAAYAYIGRRLAAGDVMYRDLTENKPPLGYWIYAATVKIGGANETTIRLMPIPLILATLILVWWLALRLGGPIAASFAGLVFAVLSTDPYVYGNGSNLEHAINLFAVASLAAMVRGCEHRALRWIFVAGVMVGCATLIKQVAVLHIGVYAIAIWLWIEESRRARIQGLLALAGGFAAACVAAVAVLAAQGAGWSAYEDIVRYGGALAAETPPEPNAPMFLVRWITGNSDPRNGRLPWPFGQTDWLVWWGTGSWPLWLAAIGGLGWLCRTGRRDRSYTSPPQRCHLVGRWLVGAWTISAWIQVALPGLFWAHYYLLPIPGLALILGIMFSDMIRFRTAAGYIGAAVLGLAFGGTVYIQTRDYMLVPPEQLTVRYKGGKQWVALRDLGWELARRSQSWPKRRLLVWGWQSPLFIYGGFDGVTRHFFVDPLLKSQAMAGQHPLIRPRLDRVMADVRRDPPELVMAGDPPFPALREFLEQNYLRSRIVPRSEQGHGLWVRRDLFSEFEGAQQPRSRAQR